MFEVILSNYRESDENYEFVKDGKNIDIALESNIVEKKHANKKSCC